MKKILSLTIAALLIAAIAVTPLSGLLADTIKAGAHKAPEGYSEYEYDLLVEFFSQPDANGVINGKKLNPDYDPDDFTTWENPDGWPIFIQWQPCSDGLQHVTSIDFTDLGMVGLLDLTDFSHIEIIDAGGNSFSQICLDGCDRCTRVGVEGSPLGSIDVSMCEYLKDINVSGCGLDELDISNNDRIIYFYASDNNIKELDFSGHTELWWVYCDGNELTELDLSDATGLGQVFCQNNNISSLRLPSESMSNFGFSALDCSNNQLTELDLSAPMYADMQILNCADNQLTELDLSSCEYLYELDMSDNMISEIDVSALEGLDKLYCSNNVLTELDISANPDITKLAFDGNDIASIDLSALTHLFILNTNYLPEITVNSEGSNNSNDTLNLFPCDISLATDGNGLISLMLDAEEDESSVYWPLPFTNSTATIKAMANDGYEFAGWYDPDGNLYSEDLELNFDETTSALTLDLVATFREAEPPMTDEPVDPTDAPVDPTDAPVDPTDAPVDPTDAPVDPTDQPVEPTQEPGGSGDPVEPTQAPDDPDIPSTGTISMLGIGLVAAISGIGVMLSRRKNG